MPAPRRCTQIVTKWSRAIIRMNDTIVRMTPVKKTWLIDPELVRRATKICGSRTETETVTRALREIVIRDEIDKAFKKYGHTLADIEETFPDSLNPRQR